MMRGIFVAVKGAESILETFYYKIVIPSVLYGIVIWGSGPKLKDLEMIHIRAA